ncbi:hypothetical protein ES288_D13G137900v1 [Gossypium darwinii]|uniref:Uncharacterized protein n=1 Tax=Gossypium darwinii TaxID=34276 RepID=A0A5D1ZXQ1_GOSDA|nr:hypothetical protein ES288_D13G137900v1 [Gossypium darwinii]
MELLFHSALIPCATVISCLVHHLGDSTELLLQSHSLSSPFRYSGTKIACLSSSQNSLQISSSPNQASIRPSSSSPQIL